ncbi:MAG: RHS repeat-associated core domain-containing protein [Clostridia bacterium]|nr:RHS repeat-associated core domain-containing protein [Clostridia bacterium]
MISQQSFGYDATYPDRLTNCGGTSISYNAMGCPTTVNGYTATWTRGKLSKLTKGSIRTGTETYNYTYNAFGQRIGINYNYMAGTSSSSAIVMGMLTSYSQTFKYDQSGRLISESKISQYYGEGSGTEKKVYLYDESGIIGMVYTSETGASTTYYFQRNLLGDVIGIYTNGDNKVGGYAYDAWGNCTITLNSDGSAIRNPIRYRGYYYDEDTKLYYLNARYYCPEWRRFISPDDTGYLDPETPNGLNLYAYCNNDPVNYCDPSGCFPVLACILGLTALVGLGLTIAGVASDNNLLTAIGLTIVAIPALISGGLAAFATTGALATVIGIGTMVAGAGTALFASAEYQEAFSGSNWMLDTGMSEDWYNGLMITTASLATLGTFASSFAYSFNINSIQKMGKIDNYYGIKFTQKAPSGNLRVKTLCIHPAHNSHPIHWQLNNINPITGRIGQRIRWDLLLRRVIGK